MKKKNRKSISNSIGNYNVKKNQITITFHLFHAFVFNMVIYMYIMRIVYQDNFLISHFLHNTV